MKERSWGALLQIKRGRLVYGGSERVLEVRTLHPNVPLAAACDRLATPADLTKAHDTLDRTVDSLLFPRRRKLSGVDRLRDMRVQYGAMIGKPC